MVDYREAAPRIYCEGGTFIVRLGEDEIGRWPDIRQAKAARWASRNAVDLRVTLQTMLDLVDYAVNTPDLWQTFDTEIDEDCVS